MEALGLTGAPVVTGAVFSKVPRDARVPGVSICSTIHLELELGEAVCLLLELGCEPRGKRALFLV
jgi:hypothetical protein